MGKLRRSLVIHPVGGLIVWVDGVFVANLLGPVPLLVHVGSADQLGTKVPVLPARQLDVHSHIIIGFLEYKDVYVDIFFLRKQNKLTSAAEYNSFNGTLVILPAGSNITVHETGVVTKEPFGL